MSGFGGFGNSGFGSNNTSGSTFGGFGATSGGGFGGNNSGFGASSSNTGGGLFGGTTNNTNTSSFGGFGANNTNNNTSTSLFGGGNKGTFGSTSSGGGLFGGTTTANTATSGNTFSGFGGSSANTGFGGGNTFGSANKTGFGTGTGSLFGGGGSTSTPSGFGTSTTANTSTGFGSSTTAFGASTQNNGTGNIPFSPFIEKEANSTATSAFQTITSMEPYKKFSTEELRSVDYAQGRKYGNSSGQAGAFGASSGFGGFGTSAPPSNTFGSTPATGGLFGGTAANNSPFGSSNATGNTFGSTNTTGGLFAPKTGTGLFGNAATTTAPSGGGLFGGGGTTTAGGFGSSTGGFGNNNNNTNTNTGGFGASTANKPFGGFGSNTNTTGGFGANNNTTGNVFGGTNAGGFGSNTNTASGGFGFANNTANNTQNQPSGGLFGGGGFGNNQPKPNGLFGNANANSGGGLFQNANNNASGSTLFGNSTANTGAAFPKPAATGGMFGNAGTNTGNNMFQNTNNTNSTGGLFASNNNNAGTGLFNKPMAGGGLFGSANAQPQGNSLFPNSQPAPATNSLFGGGNASTQANHLVATLTENPYGNAQLFTGLTTPSQSLGPLATPLSASSSQRKQAVIPQYRLMPHASSRLITPQKRPVGYGFSYSTYNSPVGSIGSGSPLSLNSSLAAVRPLGKSLSTSNLRNSFVAQDSILAPGAFSSASSGAPGSMKKLNINRSLTARRSLFGNESTGSALTKRVSFDNGIPPTDDVDVESMSGALTRTENSGFVAETPKPSNGATPGRDLAAVPEHPASQPEMSQIPKVSKPPVKEGSGEYVLTPSLAELKAMTKAQLANVKNFKVERDGFGSIVFLSPDLPSVPLELIAGQIVKIENRRASAYDTGIKKPERGRGLNVPSRITLENSWPRSRKTKRPKVAGSANRELERHLRELKKIEDTTFVSYDADKGIWVFEVQHYTTYGLDYDDDEEDGSDIDMSEEPSAAEIIVAKSQKLTPQLGSSGASEVSMDDTFDFKRLRRVRLPGQFDEEDLIADLIPDSPESVIHHDVPSADEHAVDTVDDEESDRDMEVDDVAGPLMPEPVIVDQDSRASSEERHELQASRLENFAVSSNWTKQLARSKFEARQRNIHKATQVEDSAVKGYGTTMDIMNSLFPPLDGGVSSEIRPDPKFKSAESLPSLKIAKDVVRRAPEDINDYSHAGRIMVVQYQHTEFSLEQDPSTGLSVPAARTTPANNIFEQLAVAATNARTEGATEAECQAWNLASVLFDSQESQAQATPSSVGESFALMSVPDNIRLRQRKDKLVEFWKELIAPEVAAAVKHAKTSEDAAIAHISGGDLVSACKALADGRNFKLATLIAQLPGDAVFRETFEKQLDAWDQLNVSSEMADQMRAMYGVLAGRTLVCEGKSGEGVPAENRSSTFFLSERFGLSWKRAFAMRLFYGILREEDAGEAVVRFLKDVANGGEPAVPGHDPLWGVLQVYAKVRGNTGVQDSFVGLVDWKEALPEDAARMAFQFVSVLAATNPESELAENVELFDSILYDESPSCVVNTLLSQTRALVRDGNDQHACTLFFRAAYIAVHIKDAPRRAESLDSFLNQAADLIARFNCGGKLHEKLGIPQKWLGAAKARAARDAGDVEEEVAGLVAADEGKRAMDRVFGDILPALAVRGDLAGMRRVVGLVVHLFLDWAGPKKRGHGEGGKKGVTERDSGDLDFYVTYLTLLGRSGARVKVDQDGVAALLKKFKADLDARKGIMDGIAWSVMKGEVESAVAQKGYR